MSTRRGVAIGTMLVLVVGILATGFYFASVVSRGDWFFLDKATEVQNFRLPPRFFEGMGFSQDIKKLWPNLTGNMSWRPDRAYKIRGKTFVLIRDIKDGGKPAQLPPGQELVGVVGKFDGIVVFGYKGAKIKQVAKGIGTKLNVSLLAVPSGTINDPSKVRILLEVK